MTTVAAIVDTALDAVSAAITDAVITASVSRTAVTGYDPVTDEQTTTVTVIAPRVVFEESAPQIDAYPGITIATTDQVIYSDLELVAGDNITISGKVREVLAVKDITGTGGIWSALIR